MERALLAKVAPINLSLIIAMPILKFHIDTDIQRPEVVGLEINGWLYVGETSVCVDFRARID